MARPGRSSAPIPDPDSPLGRFAQALRDLRDLAGDPGYEALARESERLGSPYSATSLRTAASGTSLPSWKVTETFVRACVEFARRHPHRAAPATRQWTLDELIPLWTARWREVSFRGSSARRPRPGSPLPDQATPPAEESRPAREPAGVFRESGELSRFIGREEELAEGGRALEDARLVTVTGPGGVGKTRLVMRLAEQTAERFPDGVRVVELAELDASMSVGQAVAAALGVRSEAGRELLDVVARLLAGRRMLLVLDNCEHVLADVAELIRVLAGAWPQVRFLASSRQPLNLAGEKVLRLGPLPLPRNGEESAAVELFVDRAAAAVPGFRLTDANRDVVHRVCHRLDGLPLALEIAARLLRVLTPHELEERLGRRFRLLGEAGTEPTAPARHRTLRAVLDWSHDLCSADERLAWERLSVCAGAVALPDAEALAAAEGMEPEAAFEAVAGLLDKSLLVRVESDGRSRLHLLETVRMYGREKLAASGGEEEARRRHREHYLGLAAQAERAYASPRQREWILRLKQEHAELRQALSSALTGPIGLSVTALREVPTASAAPADRLDLAAPSGLPEHLAVPADRVDPSGLALPGPPSADAVDREHQELVMNGVLGLWIYWLVSGNLGEYVAWGQALARHRVVPPSPELAPAWGGMLWAVALALVTHGDRVSAGRLLDRIEQVVPPERRPRWLVAAVQQLRGMSALFSSDYERAEAYSLAAVRTGGHRPGLLTGQQSLAQAGLALSARGRREEAVDLFLQALDVAEATGETWHRAYLLWALAVEYIETGNEDRATGLLRRSLELKHSLGDRLGIATVTEPLARLLTRHGEPAQAALLLGAAQAPWEPAGTRQLWGYEGLLRSWESTLKEVRGLLGEERFTEEYLAGRSLGILRVLDLVLPADR